MTLDNQTTKIFSHDKSILAYWQTIKSAPTPTVEEELELVNMAKNGDDEAKSKLIIGHQRFIFSVAKQYSKTVDEIIDYVNEGTIGLLDAIDDYDPTRGFRFITYASYFIRRQMNHYANFVNVTLYSGNKCRYQSKVKEINREYFNEFGFYPSLDTIKEIFNEKYGIAVKSVNDLYNVVVEDIDFSNEDDMTCSAREKEFNFATYSTNNYLDDEESEFMHNAIMSSLSILKPREQDIIQMFFGIGEYTEPSSSSTIAKKYNMTASAVNMIKQRALDKLKDVLTYKLAC